MLTDMTTSGDEPPAGPPHAGPAPVAGSGEPVAFAGAFTDRFVSSPRGARLARRHAVRRMEDWGYPQASDASCTVALVVGELAANAVLHGRVPGRGLGLAMVLDAVAGLVRVEVSDAADGERPNPAPPAPGPDGESGRGLLLVDVLAARWGSAPRPPVGKTVWAELVVGPPGAGRDTARDDPGLREVAADTGATLDQVVPAWLIGAEAPAIPLAEASSVAQLDESPAAVDLDFTAEQRATLDAAT